MVNVMLFPMFIIIITIIIDNHTYQHLSAGKSSPISDCRWDWLSQGKEIQPIH